MTFTAKKPQLRYAIAYTGETLPTWANSCVETLRQLKGPIDVIWICLEKNSNCLVATDVKRVRMTHSALQSFGLIGTEGSDKFGVMKNLRDLKIDFILCLTQGELGPEWSGVSKHGIWFYRFAYDFENGDNFGAREFALREATQVVNFERDIGELSARQTLKRGRFKISLSSLARNRELIFSQCCAWPAQLAQEILDTGKLGRKTSARAPSLSRPSGKRSPPRLLKLYILFLGPLRHLWHFTERLGRLFTYQQWNIGIVRGPIESLLQSQLEIDWLPAPRWPFSYADPFPVEHQGQRYIMAEQYDFRIDSGSIVVFALDHDGRVKGPPQSAIDFPFHVSYPCLVRDGSALYCVAETLETRDIAIYYCEKFPNIWTKVVDVTVGQSFADPTLFFDDGRWWVFSTLFDASSGGNSTLYAWHAEDIRGPWTPHLRNPIKSDVSSSRSAGNPFRVGQSLFRPSQDCSKYYGHRVVINKITSLSPTEFREESVRAINPDKKYPHGFHHVASFGNMILVDGRRDLFYFPAALVKFWRYAKRLMPLPSRLFPAPTAAGKLAIQTDPKRLLRLLRG